MKDQGQKRGGFVPQENLISVLPSIVAGIFIMVLTITTVLIYFSPSIGWVKNYLIGYGVSGSLYLAFYFLLYTYSRNKARFAWINSLVVGVALGTLGFILPETLEFMLYALVIIATVISSLIASRGPTYLLVFISTAIHTVSHLLQQIPQYEWIIVLAFVTATIMAGETIQRLKELTRRQVNRLEIINDLSKEIASTLAVKEVITLLDSAFQNAIEADSYYIGIIEEDEIHLELFFDEGKYFNGTRLKKKGTLSNWVMTHQQELFLPDLREEIHLEDVELVIIGKPKTALSWMGVPMRGSHINGIMAISSYKPNAFDRSDMELLSSIAQRAALALDNCYHHEMVEKQAQLDSLTQVYNHGHFIKTLRGQAETCLEQKQPLSLIMLDVDYFKQYNDTYGHQVGDEILTSLCGIIREHVKQTDAVGRWGGEEFAISLPNTTGSQAAQVSQRIRESLSGLKLQNHSSIPIPTISQGIAVFPEEADEIAKLIDLADHRLYKAKERGRDQIEPAPTLWEITKTN